MSSDKVIKSDMFFEFLIAGLIKYCYNGMLIFQIVSHFLAWSGVLFITTLTVFLSSAEPYAAMVNIYKNIIYILYSHAQYEKNV